MNFLRKIVNNYRKMLKKKALFEFLQMIENPRQRGGDCSILLTAHACLLYAVQQPAKF